ncbi:2OG-Fe(II) oxygenase [Chitinimonas arctica]|uniref:2OG-Fe(II) oxygenase n=1 Tax=Chitinimonas arctica TaxID=2594795 RepID=A0A516SIE1_9NEIS|nr:2OG-Fe(II) oxygenase [Chitinimonas arctica]QDQ27912.1 2OG-Fe(II) oxygenase [Chitinimonas arctica]
MTNQTIAYPLPSSAGHCVVIADFLSSAECAELIARSEARGYAQASTDYPPSYRNNDRQVVDDLALADRMTERLRRHAPANLQLDGESWHFDRVNERFRFCRYQPGQHFTLHQDGVHHRGPLRRSCLTFMIYLTDGATFQGGDTVFYSAGPGGTPGGEAAKEIGRVRPRAGSLILFAHSIWHAGEQVSHGIKHVMRSDLIYCRDARPDEPLLSPHERGHDGYIWTLAPLDDGLIASGGRDAQIRLWDAQGNTIRQLHGHGQSVLGLAALPGRRLASVSRDRSLRFWDWTTGHCERVVIAHEAAVLSVTHLLDRRLITCGADGLVKLWDDQGTPSGKLEGHQGWVWETAQLGLECWVSASEDGSVRLWDSVTHRCLAVLPGEVPLRALLIVGQAIWTGDIEGDITCWEEQGHSWRAARKWQAHGAGIRRLKLLDSNHVASCSEDYLLRIWHCDSGECVFEARHQNFATDVVQLGNSVLSSSYDGCLHHHCWPGLAAEQGYRA